MTDCQLPAVENNFLEADRAKQQLPALVVVILVNRDETVGWPTNSLGFIELAERLSIPGIISEDDDVQMLYRESAKQAGIIDKA